ncbi:unnamed protein product [Linum tenue]|uniref:TF-B3 domain-containing protein n=1 Tax=Linum tenue TaxID=586396 RepID=A0AAV0RB27_9ROSI|nr:unnamed protein product [Linum tenue]
MTYFLKQLTEDSITHERLLIPAEFVKKCGRENLTNPLVVEPTVGDPRERELELYEDGGVLWLRNGWQEFVDHYKLSHGCFLLFEYRSYSRFKLLMLGANGLELELPVSGFVNVGLNGNQEFPEDEEEESVDANSVEILGSSVVKEMNNNVEGGGRQPAQPRCAENAKQNGVMSARKRRAADDGEWRKANQEGPRANRANGNPFRRDKAESSRIPSMTEHEGLSMMKDMNHNNSEGSGRQQAHQCLAENAKHKEFMRPTGSKKRRTTEGAEQMRVNRRATRRNGGNGSPSGRDKADNSHIPSMEDEPAFSKRTSSSKCGRTTTTDEAADELTSQPDFCQVIIPKSFKKGGSLWIQREFIQRHITNWIGKMVELQVGEEKWHVKIIQKADGCPYLSKGWPAFARDNSLKAEDTLIFVPTTTADVLSVHILRCS